MLEWATADFSPESPEHPTHEHLLEYLCSLDVDSSMPALRNRYDDVSEADNEITLTFEESGIKENLVGPLRQAKTNYILGNYVSSIVLSGIIAEKVALFIYKKYITDEAKCEDFNNLYQPERVNRLKRLGYIDGQIEKDLRYLVEARKSYLHHWNTPEARTAERAVQAYATATRLFLSAINIKFKDGKNHSGIQYYGILGKTRSVCSREGCQMNASIVTTL